jgi:hypothetical protein
MTGGQAIEVANFTVFTVLRLPYSLSPVTKLETSLAQPSLLCISQELAELRCGQGMVQRFFILALPRGMTYEEGLYRHSDCQATLTAP